MAHDRQAVDTYVELPQPVARRRTALIATVVFLAIGAVVAVIRRWQPSYPMPEESGVGVLAGLTALTLALVLLRDGFAHRWSGSRGGWPLVLASILALAAWTNFGRFHGLTFVHHWEQFHHTLGAKYFPELGYDGLYVASLAAEATSRPGVPVQPWIRDLRDDTMVAVESERFNHHLAEVRDRFTPSRRKAFTLDHEVFLEQNSSSYLEAIRRDHGLNASPTWVALARLLVSPGHLDMGRLVWLGLVDQLLLVLAIVLLWRTYGSRVALLAVILIGTSYLGRFWWIGGALLREDWLAAVVVGLCQLERKRWGSAGAAFAAAGALRIFPILLLVGPVVSLAATRRWVELRRLLVGAAVAGVVALAIGSLAGRGPQVWLEFGEEIGRHSRNWLTNNVGLANVVLYSGEDFRREHVDFSLPEPWIAWQARMDQRLADRTLPIWVARGALLLLLVVACRRVSPDQAAALAIAAVFALTFSTCYYWQMLALLVVMRVALVTHTLLVLNLGAIALHFASPAFEFRYGLVSWLLLGLFVVLLTGIWRGWLILPAAPANPGERPRAAGWHGRHCARRPRSIDPARSSTSRCLDTAESDMSNGSDRRGRRRRR